MKKLLISLILGLTLVISGFSVSFAEVDPLDIEQGQETETTVTVTAPLSETGKLDEKAEQDKTEPMNDGEEQTPISSLPEETTETTGEKPATVSLSFSDVQDPSIYYYHPIYWAVKNEITQGTSETEFSPDASCTRAQIVTFLWRKAGKPEPKTLLNPFTDISESDYYYRAVLWAVESNVTSGTSENTFSPDDHCTRAQCVTFLWRASSSPYSQIKGPFRDVNEDDYYYGAVNWALEQGVTSGTSPDNFSPDASCTRAQTVTFFFRASLENAEQKETDGEVVTGTLNFEDPNGKTGVFVLRAEGVSSESDVLYSRVSVWTQENRGDLHWYELTSEGNGTWKTILSVQDFNGSFGVFHAKLYAVTGSEKQIELDNREFDFQPEGYMFTEALGNREIRVTILGVPEGNTVSFASWSDENYLDDLFWTEAKDQGDGVWSAVLETANFASAGICYTDAYLDKTEVFNTTSYSVELWETMSSIEWEIYGYTQDIYRQVGTDLYSLFKWCVGITYYRATPEPARGYTNSQWYALYGYKYHKGHCYVHAATFYWLAKNLGYEIYYLQGYVPRRGGGEVTHGWTELILNGTKYVVDPNFTNETGRNGFKITYGTSGTWRYQNYRRMS